MINLIGFGLFLFTLSGLLWIFYDIQKGRKVGEDGYYEDSCGGPCSNGTSSYGNGISIDWCDNGGTVHQNWFG
jgi:hypothetical protein